MARVLPCDSQNTGPTHTCFCGKAENHNWSTVDSKRVHRCGMLGCSQSWRD